MITVKIEFWLQENIIVNGTIKLLTGQTKFYKITSFYNKIDKKDNKIVNTSDQIVSGRLKMCIKL